MARLTPAELAKEISNFVNGARQGEIKELAELMSQDHPTLQQNTMGLVAHFIQTMQRKSYTDARNQDSVDMANAMSNGYQRFLVDKFMGQGMAEREALDQAHTCSKNLAGNLPLI